MHERLTLRSRLAILASVTTAATSLAVALFGYGLARHSVVGDVDSSLIRDQQRYARRLLATGKGIGLGQELATTPIVLLNGNGKALRSTAFGAVSVEPLDIAIARGSKPAQFSNRNIDGRRYRFYTGPGSGPSNSTEKLARFDLSNGGPGLAIAVGRDVELLHQQLERLAFGFLILAASGIAISAIAIFIAVRIGTRSLKELHQLTDVIATGENITVTASTRGPRDIATFSASFNAMVNALQESRLTQQRMIDDAAHELRTPLTSMQTNLDILNRAKDLDPGERSDILCALSSQFAELRSLVHDLGLLAEQTTSRLDTFVAVDLAEVAADAIERVKHRSSSVCIRSDISSFSVLGDRDRLERSVVNILDNALKWSPPNSTVYVDLVDGVLRIADQGPGVPADERARVFDRFWRASATRGTPGSGLGLAIVADIIELHGGSVEFGESEYGGALVTVRLLHLSTTRRSGSPLARETTHANNYGFARYTRT
jgi:two-component system, OmpR family, sensor histidine kinase MprB